MPSLWLRGSFMSRARARAAAPKRWPTLSNATATCHLFGYDHLHVEGEDAAAKLCARDLPVVVVVEGQEGLPPRAHHPRQNAEKPRETETAGKRPGNGQETAVARSHLLEVGAAVPELGLHRANVVGRHEPGVVEDLCARTAVPRVDAGVLAGGETLEKRLAPPPPRRAVSAPGRTPCTRSGRSPPGRSA